MVMTVDRDFAWDIQRSRTDGTGVFVIVALACEIQEARLIMIDVLHL